MASMHDIPDQWYPVIDSAQVSSRKPLGVTRLGKRMVLWRGADGRIVCAPDRCTHRSAVLSTGRMVDGCIECPYHGLRFTGPANAC